MRPPEGCDPIQYSSKGKLRKGQKEDKRSREKKQKYWKKGDRGLQQFQSHRVTSKQITYVNHIQEGCMGQTAVDTFTEIRG